MRTLLFVLLVSAAAGCWLLADLDESCDTKCGNDSDFTCQVAGLSSVNSESKVNAVSTMLGQTDADDSPTLSSSNLAPFITTANEVSYPDGSASTCNSAGAAAKRYCCCATAASTISTDCPLSGTNPSCTTLAPTTAAPTTLAPTTPAPTTAAPTETTKTPTTLAPTPTNTDEAMLETTTTVTADGDVCTEQGKTAYKETYVQQIGSGDAANVPLLCYRHCRLR